MIELKDIVIRYGSFTAVQDLSIQINEGEFFTFLGPSGCGKTTTLRGIAGFETPTEGVITAFGRQLSGLLPEERDIGFVFQNYALFPSMDVYENIAFGLKAHKVPKKEIPARGQAVAEKTGITEHLKKRINDLSGGQQQREADARFYVRSHYVSIQAQNQPRDGAVVLDVTIENYEFLGAYTKISAKTDDGNVITSVMFGAETEFSIGAQVAAVIPLKAVLALKEVTP